MPGSPASIPVPDAFRLSAAAAFYGGFQPMAGAALASRAGSVTLAFLLEPDFVPVGVGLSQSGATLTAEVDGTDDLDAVWRQVKRMLGLDADADAWIALGRREPEVGALQAGFPGFFTATFPSPWEAGIGGIVTQGVPLTQASALRRKLSDALGTSRAGLRVLPSPRAVLDGPAPDFLPPRKWEAIRALAEPACAGRLGAERLRERPRDEVLAELRALPGIGPWTAEHVLLRGAAPPDGLPGAEPRVLRAIGHVYRLPETPTAAEAGRWMERWRPFRMWVSILAVRALARDGGWNDPTDRARRGRR